MPNADALGQYILLSVPYQAQPAAAAFPPPAVPPVHPPPPPLPNLDLLYGLCLDEAQTQDYQGRWEFRGAARTVARALRIPYMYYRPNPNGGSTLVTDHLLIGFEGAGGP